MATTADISKGTCIEFNNDIYQIIEFQHVQVSRGPAFVRTKLKSMRTGKVIENTFTSGHRIQTARIERRKFQFLYKDDMGFNFMDSNTFEQLTLQEEQITGSEFMKDGQEVEITFHAEKEVILGCELPQFVILQITYSEPGIKGDTATNTLKPATLETGAIINVPLFVNEGDLIKIDTQTRSYVERAK